ncbi:iron-dependent repressor [uncultured archaeon]|nr:iron-dependent repressor [uncultured archaeon]
MTINTNEVTKKERDCLLVLSRLQDGEFPARLSEISRDMGIKAPTALNIIERLEEKSMVERKKGMVLLTKEGEATVSSLLFIHRVMETLFVTSGVPTDNACEEVEKFDYLIPVSSASKVSKSIGSPKMCPHGEAIELEERQ